MQTTLSFKCPHCNHQYDDDLELLEANQIHEIRCEKCQTSFCMQFAECSACCSDTPLVWPTHPQFDSPSPLACHSCGTAFHSTDECEIAGEVADLLR
jgi:hypothetical protein